MTAKGLFDAVYALRELAAGKTPDRARLQCGALSLSTEKLNGTTDRDLLDAAAILDAEATGRHIDADQAGRNRALYLAGIVSDLAKFREQRDQAYSVF